MKRFLIPFLIIFSLFIIACGDSGEKMRVQANLQPVPTKQIPDRQVQTTRQHRAGTHPQIRQAPVDKVIPEATVQRAMKDHQATRMTAAVTMTRATARLKNRENRRVTRPVILGTMENLSKIRSSTLRRSLYPHSLSMWTPLPTLS